MAGRPSKTSSGFAPLESEVMDAVWATTEPVSVREVVDALNERRSEPLAYTTVMTVMNRLVTKNVLARSGERRRYLYEATAADAVALFLAHKISCIPVVDDGFRPVGIVSWRDLLKSMAAP